MSAFFRGPSLTTHVFVLAVIEAIGVPSIRELTRDVSTALLAGLGFGVIYVGAALLYAVGSYRKRRNGPDDAS